MTTTAASRVPRAVRREQLLDAAGALITARGIDAVTMEALALTTGVNKALVYRHFANRGGVLTALFDREVADLDARVKSAVALPAMLHTWLEGASQRGPVVETLLGARSADPALAGRVRDREEAITRRFARLVAREWSLPDDVATDATTALLAALAGVLARWRAEDAVGRARVEETYTRLVVAGLAALS